MNKKCDINCKILYNKKREVFKKIAKVQPYPGIENLLKELKQKRKKVALVTGTSRSELPKVLPNSIFKLFDIVITADDVNNGKPNPEPYLKALNLLNLDKKETIVVENAPLGIKSAKATGLFCIAVTTSLPKKFLYEADVIVKNIKELRNLIL